MTNILHAVGGMMLFCIPVSMLSVVLNLSRYREKWGCDMPLGFFMVVWGVSYLYRLLFAAVGFAGVVGVAMLTGAFR